MYLSPSPLTSKVIPRHCNVCLYVYVSVCVCMHVACVLWLCARASVCVYVEVCNLRKVRGASEVPSRVGEATVGVGAGRA
jgi:hypothetical protein